ncbi:hypothetical protein QFC22_000712 [Naganishia vaughanmartiniae]|uniref:Uncharacterized protein n=1 Tax=Naganishia vaughanmartiniae TaxID=1424756 RepID=A0ACC2XJU8_9TREE|nr:hypothetical protein QFC22_000712 [Naganishia vaughanmartiniae]
MNSLDTGATKTITEEEEHLLLATHDSVQQLSETPRGAWLKSKIKYENGHPFAVTNADTGEESNVLGDGTTERYPPVQSRRTVFQHLERLHSTSQSTDHQPEPHTVHGLTPAKDASNTTSTSVSQRPEIILSPSPGDEPKQHHKTSLRGPRSKPGAQKNKNILSLNIPPSAPTAIIITAASPTTPVNPITLVPPRTLALRAEIDLADPKMEDTHADALTRLLFVLLRNPAHPPPYVPEITVDLASILYALYATGGDVEALQEGGGQWFMNEYAEADAYWCVRALMGEVALAGLLVPGNQLLKKLAKRVFWADDGLYRLLIALHLDPAKDAFAHEWLKHMLVRTVNSLPQLFPLWDAVIAESDDLAMGPGGTSSKMELLIDVCTAMLLLVKDSLRTITETHPNKRKDVRHGFWQDGDDNRLLFDEDAPDLPADLNEEKSILAREMLRAYPMEAVEVDEVLRVAGEIRQRRIMALLDGEELDDIALPITAETPDTVDFASKLESLALKARSSVRETISPLPRYTTAAPIVDIGSVRNSLLSSGERLKDYASTLQKSDAAAQVSKVSSNLTAVALMKLNDLTASGTNEEEGQSAWSLAAASKLWSRNSKAESDVAALLSREQAQVADAASPGLATENAAMPENPATESPMQDAPASLFRRDTNLPPSFITPRGSIIYPAGRYRPKAAAMGQAKPSLQSRLAAVASTPANIPATTLSPDRAAVRPLILSKSAKPASPLPGQLESAKTSTGSNISPSPSLQSLNIDNYVPRRVSISRRSQRSSVGGAERDDSGGSDSVQSTSARLRKATRDSYGTTSSDIHHRYRLSDPGAGEDTTPDTSSQVEAGRYQLRDEVAPLSETDTSAPVSRRESVDDAVMAAAGTGGVSRSKVVRKGKFVSKAAHFRLQSAGHIDLEAEGIKSDVSMAEAQINSSVDASPGRQPTSSVLAVTPVRESSLTTPPKSLILPERPERSSSLLKSQQTVPKRPTVDMHHLEVVQDGEEDEPLSAKDGYGDLLESYAAALESL